MSEIEICSYRAVFSLERRVYQLDTLRLNPAGVPLRGLVYCAALVLLALLGRAAPGISALLAPLPWYLCDLAAPVAAGAVLAMLRIEGRPFHLAAGALLALWVGPRCWSRLAPRRREPRSWHPPPVVLIPDGSEARPRALRYQGPGAVLVAFAHDRVEWSPGLLPWRRRHVSLHPVAHPRAIQPVALELAAGAKIEVSTRPFGKRGR
jgi:hypothetical protein